MRLRLPANAGLRRLVARVCAIVSLCCLYAFSPSAPSAQACIREDSRHVFFSSFTVVLRHTLPQQESAS